MKLANVIVYIAGPVTGVPGGNRDLFNEAAQWLSHQGAIPLNPTLLPFGLKSHQSYMNICLPMLREADAVVFLPGWRASVGARMEHREASCLGMPLFQYSSEPDAHIIPWVEADHVI